MPTPIILASVTAAGYYDLRWRRVPNWLVGLTLGVALTWHAVAGGFAGLGASAAGLIVGTLVLFPLFAIRAMGAGDVKFMGAVGAMVTLRHLPTILLVALLVAAALAVWSVLRQGALARTLGNIGDLCLRSVSGRLGPHPSVSIDNAQALLVPFTLAAAIATWIVMVPEALK